MTGRAPLRRHFSHEDDCSVCSRQLRNEREDSLQIEHHGQFVRESALLARGRL